MAKGGLRPNAGRKKANHTIEAEKAREYVVNKVVEKLEPLMESHFALALGHKVMMVRELVKDKKTGKYERTGKWIQVTSPLEIQELLNGDDKSYYEIWTKSPDGNDLQYLTSQAVGKPKETVEMSGKEGKPIEIDVSIKQTLDRIYGSKPTSD